MTVLMAAWFALLVGFMELAIFAVRKFILQQTLFVGQHVLWMAPLSYMTLFVGCGLGLCCVSWLHPRLASLRVTTFIFAWLSGISCLFLFHPSLHRFAIVFLATGLAIQISRLSTRYAQSFQRVIKVTGGWMLALAVGLGVAERGWVSIAEQRQRLQLPAATPHAPNVLLIVLDTVRAQSLSLYGYHRSTTPHLDRLAQQGVLFEQAIATAPWTTPSHASMFTGYWPHELQSAWTTTTLQPLAAAYPTVAEVLQQQGYLTAGFVANMEYCSYETGLQRGFLHYEDYPVSWGQMLLSSSLGRVLASNPTLRRWTAYDDLLNRKTAATINGDFLGWLARQERRPFFVFLNYYDAHEPYLPPPPFSTVFGPQDARKPAFLQHFPARMHQAKRMEKARMSQAEVQAERDAYEGSIAYIDQQLGHLVEALEKRRIFSNTLIIITSDHGEQFGEHHLFEHGNSLYLPLLHVPLLLVYPTHIPAGKRVSSAVSLRDLPATIVDILGIAKHAGFPGTSLRRYWHTGEDTTPAILRPPLSELSPQAHLPAWRPVAQGHNQSLILDQYHYIKNGDGSEELYNITADPEEQHNLIRQDHDDAILSRLRKFVTELWHQSNTLFSGRL